MPSPPLVPDDGPIDVTHLRSMTLGDPALEREVLTMFLSQTAQLAASLAKAPPDAAALAHTLKGSARAIGAFAVADAAGQLETTIKSGGDRAHALGELNEAIAQARDAIEAMLNQGD